MLTKKNKKKTPEFKKPFIVLNRRRLFGWGLAVFCLCAWMFVLGVLVGRDSAPVKFNIPELQQKLESLKPGAQENELDEPPEEPAVVKDKTKLEFYEALPQNRNDTTLPNIEKPGGAPGQKIEPAPPKRGGEAAQKNAADEKKPPATQPAKTSEPQKQAVASDATSSGPSYTIQVAAFKNAADADKLVSKLKGSGYPAYRAIGKISGKGIWFRVRTGDYKNKTQARAEMEKLKKFGLQPILVEK